MLKSWYGFCGYCNRWIDWIIDVPHDKVFLLATITSSQMKWSTIRRWRMWKLGNCWAQGIDRIFDCFFLRREYVVWNKSEGKVQWLNLYNVRREIRKVWKQHNRKHSLLFKNTIMRFFGCYQHPWWKEMIRMWFISLGVSIADSILKQRLSTNIP